MKKYFLIAKNTWDEVFTYRLNFVMYRVRNILTFLTMYYLWLALLSDGVRLFGYSQSMLITYIFGSAFIQSLVLASRSYSLGDDIINGNLSNFLIRPINYFYYWLSKDIGDKAMNISFSIIELLVLFIIFNPPIIIQTDIYYVILFIISLAIAISLYFLFNLILGMIGFWSPEVLAPRFIFMVLIGFFSGGYFPLDILPRPLFLLFQALPFHYLTFFPLKIYLKQISMSEIIYGLGLGIIWVSLLMTLVKLIWIKGLREYTAQGR